MKQPNILRNTTIAVVFFTLLTSALIPSYLLANSQFKQVPGLIDLRTPFSDGEHDLDFLVNLARKRGFEVLVLNDHERMAMEYGVFPLRNIIKKKVEKPSVNLIGAQKYLDEVARVNSKYPDMLVIPGVETAPFYYWSGNPFTKGLTAHDWEKHILVMGLEKADDIAALPALHNKTASAYNSRQISLILVFLSVAILGLFIVRWKNFRFIGLILIVSGGAFSLNAALFNSSQFDQYHGEQGIAPYQRLIDYVNDKGGVTFWNHPETRTGIGKKDIIRVETKPYPEVLNDSKEYTGFATLYGDLITAIEPGNKWDKVLLEYCNGQRTKPVWGISTADYHGEGESGEELGNFATIFLMKQLTSDAVYNALKNGKMYTTQGAYHKRGILSEFSIFDKDRGISAVSGDELPLTQPATIKIKVHAYDGGAYKAKVRLIRDGELAKSYTNTTPFTIEFEDSYFSKGKKSFYRVFISGDMGRIVSNPIFVTWQ